MAEKLTEHQPKQTEERKRTTRPEAPIPLSEDFAQIEEVFPSAEMLLTPGTGRPDPLPRPGRSAAFNHNHIISLQQTCGNSYVQQWLAPAIVQAKLTTQQAGDKYEREADIIAAEVGTGPDSQDTGRRIAVSPMEKKPLPGAFEEDEDRGSPGSLETRIEESREGGQPLHESVRRTFQGRMGHDFSGVRIHADAESDTLSHELGAEAFTTGEDIFFRTGNYQPHTKGGRELIAHELAHVAQQNSGEPSGDGMVLQLFRSGSAGGAMFSEGPEDVIGIRMSYQIDSLETILSTINEVIASGFGAGRDYSANPAFQSALRAYLQSIGHASVTGGGPRMSRERWLHFHIRLVRGEANRIQNIQFIQPDRPRTEEEEGEGFTSEYMPEEATAPVEEEAPAEEEVAPIEAEAPAAPRPRRQLTEGQQTAAEAAGVMDTVGYWASARWLWDPILEAIGGWEHELDEAGEHIRREPVLGEVLLPFVSVLFVILQAITGTLDLLARINPLNVAARIASLGIRGISGVNTGEELLEELSPLGREGLNLLTLGIGNAAAHLREAYDEMNIFRFIQGVSEVIMAVLAILGIRSAAGALRARLSGAPRVAGAAPTEAVAAEARVATPEARVATPEARVATPESTPAELAETGFEQSIPPEMTETAVAEAAPELAETGIAEAAPVEPIETARTGMAEARPAELAETGVAEAAPAEPIETARTGVQEATPAELAETGVAETPRAGPGEPIEGSQSIRLPATDLPTPLTVEQAMNLIERWNPDCIWESPTQSMTSSWELTGGEGAVPDAYVTQSGGFLRLDIEVNPAFRDAVAARRAAVRTARSQAELARTGVAEAAPAEPIESARTGVQEAAPPELAETGIAEAPPAESIETARTGVQEATPAELAETGVAETPRAGPGEPIEGSQSIRLPATDLPTPLTVEQAMNLIERWNPDCIWESPTQSMTSSWELTGGEGAVPDAYVTQSGGFLRLDIEANPAFRDAVAARRAAVQSTRVAPTPEVVWAEGPAMEEGAATPAEGAGWAEGPAVEEATPAELAETGMQGATPAEGAGWAEGPAVEGAPSEGVGWAEGPAMEQGVAATPAELAETGVAEVPGEALEMSEPVVQRPIEQVGTPEVSTAEPGRQTIQGHAPGRAPAPIESLEGINRFEPATELEPGGPRIEYTVDTEATVQSLRDQVMRGERPGRVSPCSREWLQGEWESMGGRGEAPLAWWTEDGALRLDWERSGWASPEVQTAGAARIAERAQAAEAESTRAQLQAAAEQRAQGARQPAEEQPGRSPAEVGINIEIVDVEQARQMLQQYRSEGRPVITKTNRSMGRAYEDYGGDAGTAPVAFVSGSGVLVINMQALNAVGAAP